MHLSPAQNDGDVHILFIFILFDSYFYVVFEGVPIRTHPLSYSLLPTTLPNTRVSPCPVSYPIFADSLRESHLQRLFLSYKRLKCRVVEIATTYPLCLRGVVRFYKDVLAI